MIMTYEEVCGNAWSTGENSSFSSWLSGELVLILPMKGSYLLNGEFSSQLTLGGGGGVGEGGCLYALDPRGSPPMILYFTGDLVDYLNSWGSFLGNF